MNHKFNLMFLFSSIFVTLLLAPVVQAACGCDCQTVTDAEGKLIGCEGAWARSGLSAWSSCTINPADGYRTGEGSSCTQGNSKCHTGYCPSGASNRDPCRVNYNYWELIGGCGCRPVDGVWDAYDDACVTCDGKKEQYKIADTSGIYSETNPGDGQCESACGASDHCDEKSPNSYHHCHGGQNGDVYKCDSNCNDALYYDCGNSGCVGSCPGCAYHTKGCSAGSCYDNSHDPDESSTYCSGCSLYWNIGGDISNCCGDDSGEYRIVETSGTDAPSNFYDGTDACCNANNKCVEGNTCYSDGATAGIIPNKGYCNSGTWEGGDVGSTQCEAIVDLNHWNIGGEIDPTKCCGDDSGEYKGICQQGSGEDACDISTDDEACCDNDYDCVYQDTCYSSGHTEDIDADDKIEKCDNGVWILLVDCNALSGIYGDTAPRPSSYAEKNCTNRWFGYPYNSAKQYREYYPQDGKCRCRVTYDAYVDEISVSSKPAEPVKCIDVKNDPDPDTGELPNIIDIVDIVYVAIHFGEEEGDPNWEPDVDLNNDGIIDIVDIVIVAIEFGKRTDGCNPIE